MAEKNTAARPDPEELVEYTAPLVYEDRERDVLVAVNGETIRLLRGVPVRIKRKHLEVLENARTQAEAARRLMEEARSRSGDAAARF